MIRIEQANYKYHYFSLCFLKEIMLAHFQSLFGRSNCDVSWKIKRKNMKEVCEWAFFVNLQFCIW